METSTIRKRGTIVLPKQMRKRYGFEDGSVVIIEETPEGLLIRPAAVVPIEIYSNERKAEFILSNSLDSEDYELAREEVRGMGLDPDDIDHARPGEG